MAVTESKAPAITIRENLILAKEIRQQLRDDRRVIDVAIGGRESDYAKLADAGSGPVSFSEIEKLQRARWEILATNQKSHEQYLSHVSTAIGQLNEMIDDSRNAIEQYIQAEQDRIVALGVSPSNANSRIGCDPDIAQLKQAAFSTEQVRTDLRRLVADVQSSIDGIDDQRKLLSRKWRTI